MFRSQDDLPLQSAAPADPLLRVIDRAAAAVFVVLLALAALVALDALQATQARLVETEQVALPVTD
ncbi:hypothetical protein [Salipiger abyssi]|uniref:hypothetical protein n=1 Tax=Salipiger abyssi TaxID=1250539 RepID=UPI001A8D4CD5|nr:hypothetical protein [Salipiger abyssi]MBN9887560.1 hypothetical protein [Salipiger abyssi]